TYTVALNATDGEGCSTQLVYTGQTASCAGSAVATRSILAGHLSLTLGGAKKQGLTRKGIVVKVRCNIAPCDLVAAAKGKALGLKTRVSRKRAKKPGVAAKLKLRFSPHPFSEIHGALSSGGPLAAKVIVTAKAVGERVTEKRTVRLSG